MAGRKGADVESGKKKTGHTTILDKIDELPMNLKMLILANNNLLDNASFQVLRNADDAFTQIQAQGATGILAGTDTVLNATQKMLNGFANKGITTFKDKAGRNWDLASYSEMCARTVTSHAALQGEVDRQVELGEDLVKVSSIGTTCPICMPWQGVVLSISGKDTKYRSLESARAAGLFHPNCKHTIMMFIPDLDGEGKVDPTPVDKDSVSYKRNKLIEQQRSNERNIRYWKKRLAVAITDEDKALAQSKIKYWQNKNLLLCTQNDLRREYPREGIRVGVTGGKTGAPIGGHLKDYETFLKEVGGIEPKEVAPAVGGAKYGTKDYELWVRDSVKDFSELDIDRAATRGRGRTKTPTDLYRKYIGDTPTKDYESVSPYSKGTKEYRMGYIKWLQEQIDSIGTKYILRPTTPSEPTKMPKGEKKPETAVEFVRRKMKRPPTKVFSELGGKDKLGKSFGEWVMDERARIEKEEATPKVKPKFESTPLEDHSKVMAKMKEDLEKAKKAEMDAAIAKYKDETLSKILAPKEMSSEMKDLSGKIIHAEGFEKEKLKTLYEEAKKRDLDILKVYSKMHPGEAEFEIDWMKTKVLDSDKMSDEVKEHVKAKKAIWEGVKKEEDAKKKADKKRKKEIEKVKKFVADIDSLPKMTTLMDIQKTYDEVEKAKDDGDDVEAKHKQEILKIYTDAFKKKSSNDKFGELEKGSITLSELDREIAAKEKKAKSYAASSHKFDKKEEYMVRLNIDAYADARDRFKQLEADRVAAAIAAANKSARTAAISSKFKDALPCDQPIIDMVNIFAETKKNKYSNTINELANSWNVSPDEARNIASEKLQDCVENGNFGMRIRVDNFEKVLSAKDGGFKSLFEVGKSGGCSNKNMRASGEQSTMNLPDWEGNSDVKDRPIYGMVLPPFKNDGTDSDNVKEYYSDGPGSWYGDGITVIINKNAVINNATIACGDTLDYSGYLCATSASDPQFNGSSHGFQRNVKKNVDKFKKQGIEDLFSGNDEYLEMQIHGKAHHGVEIMEKVYFTESAWQKASQYKIIERLDELGIPYEKYK
jgi:hypothetical protein